MDDIIVTDGAEVDGCMTAEIVSRTQGHLAWLAFEADRWRTMMLASTLDHITEPRNVEDYSIRRSNNTSDRWILMWGPDNGCEPYLLGQFTSMQGAQRLLDYLKLRAKERS